MKVISSFIIAAVGSEALRGSERHVRVLGVLESFDGRFEEDMSGDLCPASPSKGQAT